MHLLKRLTFGLAALIPLSCGSRSYCEKLLLDPCITDGTTLTVYINRETGTKKTSSGGFNPNGPRTTRTVTRADLYRADFTLVGNTATLSSSQHLLGLEGKPLNTAITTADGFLAVRSPLQNPDEEIHTLAPQGNAFCVQRDGYIIYSDNTRATEVDRGALESYPLLYFTWSGEQMYSIDTDEAGRLSRIRYTTVGSKGVWAELVYDAERNPIDAEPGMTFVDSYDVLDGEPVLLLRKHYRQDGQGAHRSASYALLHGTRLVTTWDGIEVGRIRPDIRAFVSWERSYGSLKATLTLRSLDDGNLRTITVDANPALP